MGTDWNTTSRHSGSSAWQGALDVVGGTGRRVGYSRSCAHLGTRFDRTWTCLPSLSLFGVPSISRDFVVDCLPVPV
jgi:hypothetical protein